MHKERFRVIAMRGESHDAPENTMASIDLAWKRDIEAVHIDIRRSSCGRIVVLCDDNTMRVAKKNKKVYYQCIEELMDLDVGKYKGKEWKGEKIPLLEDVLSTVEKKKKIYIEIKTGPKILSELRRELEKSGVRHSQVIIMSFDYKTISEVKKELPEYKALWQVKMFPDFKTKQWRPELPDVIQRAQQSSIDGVCVKCCDIINKPFVESVLNEQLEMYVWEVQSPEDAAKYSGFGVLGGFTERADYVRSNM